MHTWIDAALCAALTCGFILAYDTETPAKRFFHNDPNLSSFRVGNARFDSKTGVPVAIYNADYIASGDSPQEMADDFIKNNSELLGCSAMSKKEQWKVSSTRSTETWTTIRYKQEYNGISVYNADLVITINKDNVVRMVTSTYKKGIYIDDQEIFTKQSENKVFNMAVTKYGKGRYELIKNHKAEPVIYHQTKRKSVLAWKTNFAVISDEYMELEVVYEDSSGSILLEVEKTLDKQGGKHNKKVYDQQGGPYKLSKAEEAKRNHHETETLRSQTNSDKGERYLQSNDIIEMLTNILSNESTQAMLSSIFDVIQLLFDLLIDNPTTLLSNQPSSGAGLFTNIPTSTPTIEPTFHFIVSDEPIGNVFDPDPLSSAREKYSNDCETGFCDNNDGKTHELFRELQSVVLNDITYMNGKYHLKGPFACVVDINEPFYGTFESDTNNFKYERSAHGFEAVNAYYHIDQMMRYINDELGIFVEPTEYAGGVRFDPHSSENDNSYYDRSSQIIHFGTGGVDDAEDADVIIHELGHGIHQWITGGDISQVQGLSEGFGDYLAASYSRSRANSKWKDDDVEYHWVFKWDAHNEFLKGRKTITTKIYPQGLVEGELHENGIIWASCTMRIYDKIGRTKADKAILIGLQATGSESNQEDAANAVYLAASDLNYEPQEIQDIREIFVAQGYKVSDGVCGDGVKNDFEECDTNDIGNATCLDIGCSGGTPKCRLNCLLDYGTCTVGENDMTLDLEINFDNYANETSWTLVRESDGVLIDSGGQGTEYDHLNGMTAMASVCMAEEQCFVLTIYDNEGDGICCSFGEGSFNILLDGEPIAGIDPSFGDSISYYIGSNCPPRNRCGDGIRGAFEECDGVDFGTATCAKSECSDGHLTCTNECKIDYSQCKASISELSVSVIIKLDQWPLETSWNIYSMADLTQQITSGGEYEGLNGHTVKENFCLSNDRCYQFQIHDENGDGICCSYGFGDYSVLVNDDPLPNTFPNFTYSRLHYFGLDCPT